MSSHNTKSHKSDGFDDLTIPEMKRPDQINGQNNETNSSTPVPTTTVSSTSILEMDDDLTVKEKKNVDGESNKRKFSISLSKREIEEDLYSFTGKRHLRCKKRRGKTTKKDLDDFFPGSSLDGNDVESLPKRYDSESASYH
ncbi:hypothetical protein L1887_34329 [Cichorium endivia]|nr:hypothetical protein L1887_34329 [Cichorium endivia]